jgi:hypothetical protein
MTGTPNDTTDKTHTGSMGTDRNPPSGTDHIIANIKTSIPQDKK